jgi:hypothetical protein
MTKAVAVGQKGTMKRNLVGKTVDGEYPQTLEFEFFGKNVDLINSVKENDTVEIKFDIRGREWAGKDGKSEPRVFVSLSAFGIRQMREATAEDDGSPVAPMDATTVDDEDIPF